MDSGARNMLTTGKWDTCGLLTKNIEEIKTTATKLPYLTW
jgi:3-isopropylmalate/(R)-2-methylmalate dehydratase small subunit